MRVASVLTMLACAFFVSGASASIGQTKPQEKAHRKVTCTDAERAIRYYREQTWQSQERLFLHHEATRYAEKLHYRCAYKRWAAHLWQSRSRAYNRRIERLERDTRSAICYVFGRYCSQALRVAGCESSYHVTAQNGQYLGLFQMGSYARQLYGHSRSAISQSYSAYKYFVDSGKDWSPWSCKPW